MLDLGMKVDKGNLIILALADVTAFPMPKKEIRGEQLKLVRRLLREGANLNVGYTWYNSMMLSPLDVLILSDNTHLIDEFLKFPLDRSKGHPVALAASMGNIDLMMKLIDLQFPASQGDVISAYLDSAQGSAQIEKIDELIKLGAKVESSNALLTACFPFMPPEIAMQLIDRNVSLSEEAANGLFDNIKVVIQSKRFDVLNRILDKVTNLNNIVFDFDYNVVSHVSTLTPKTALIRLIEEQEFDLAQRLIDLGASIEVQNVVAPEEPDFVLKNNSTNYVLAACLEHNNERSTLFAIELIARGAPFANVNLKQVIDTQPIGEYLFDLATKVNNQEAMKRLKAEGFGLKPDLRAKPIQYAKASGSTSEEKLEEKPQIGKYSVNR